MPRISVVIPTYNRLASTRAAVRSVLAQTLPADEIIVVDDCSTEAVDAPAFESLDPRVSLYRTSVNMGAAGARQAGVDRCTSELVAFLDSDDLWSPTKLERQMPLLADARHDLVAASCGWREFDEDGVHVRTRVPVTADNAIAFASGCWFCPGTTVMLPRRAFDTVGPFDIRMRRLEDLDWYVRFGLAGGRLEVVRSIEAEISVGARARVAAVMPARDLILQKARSLPDAGDSRVLVRQLQAWLDVELARAAWKEGDAWSALKFLAQSLATAPRPRLHLRRWWERIA